MLKNYNCYKKFDKMSQLILQFKVYKKANEKEGYFNSYTEHFIKYFDKKVQKFRKTRFEKNKR